MNFPLDELIRIVILDSHTLVRAGLRLIVDSQPDMKVVGEADNAKEGLEIVSSLKPDVILLKIDPVDSIRLDIIKQLLKASCHSRIILLARLDEVQVHMSAVQEGVLGVVLKTQPAEILIKAIRKVHVGEAWIERSMVANLINDLTHAQHFAEQDPENERMAQLSDRERQVIHAIGQGLKNYQIAEQLSISETTVRHHLTSIYRKLGVTDRLELLVYAHRNSLE